MCIIVILKAISIITCLMYNNDFKFLSAITCSACNIFLSVINREKWDDDDDDGGGERKGIYKEMEENEMRDVGR